MTKWYYNPVFDGLRDTRCSKEALFSRLAELEATVLLPAAGRLPVLLLPAQRAGLRVNVAEDGDEIVVTADMIPGVTKQGIGLGLINPGVLEISTKGGEEWTEENDGYRLSEHRTGSMTRIIPLPKPVSEDGSAARFRDGILEVRLKKQSCGFGEKIRIE